MSLDGPSLTDVVNLLVAVGAFAAMVGAALMRARKWARDDMTAIVKHELAPVKAEQTQMSADQAQIWEEQKKLSAKFDVLQSSMAGHESRLSFLEGKDAARAEFRNPPPVELTGEEL